MGKNINGDRPTAFPLEQEKLPFTIPVVDEPRPKIAKLVAMITDPGARQAQGRQGQRSGILGPGGPGHRRNGGRGPEDGRPQAQDHRALMKLTKLEREPLQKLLDDWPGWPDEYNWENLDGKNPNQRKAVCPAPVRPRQRGVFQHAAQPDGRASPGGGLL